MHIILESSLFLDRAKNALKTGPGVFAGKVPFLTNYPAIADLLLRKQAKGAV